MKTHAYFTLRNENALQILEIDDNFLVVVFDTKGEQPMAIQAYATKSLNVAHDKLSELVRLDAGRYVKYPVDIDQAHII